MKNLLECFDVILSAMDLTNWLPDDVEKELPVEETGMLGVKDKSSKQALISRLFNRECNGFLL